MKYLWKKLFLFATGGCSYMALEFLWRGWSHSSMFLAGGSCFLLLGKLNRTQPRLPLPLRAVAGAGIITCVELTAGLLANRNYTVWDYRNAPYNFYGQVCLPFSLLWIPLSFVGMQLFNLLSDLLLLLRQWHFAKLPQDSAYEPGLFSKLLGRKCKDR